MAELRRGMGKAVHAGLTPDNIRGSQRTCRQIAGSVGLAANPQAYVDLLSQNFGRQANQGQARR